MYVPFGDRHIIINENMTTQTNVENKHLYHVHITYFIYISHNISPDFKHNCFNGFNICYVTTMQTYYQTVALTPFCLCHFVSCGR